MALPAYYGFAKYGQSYYGIIDVVGVIETPIITEVIYKYNKPSLLFNNDTMPTITTSLDLIDVPEMLSVNEIKPIIINNLNTVKKPIIISNNKEKEYLIDSY